MSEQADRSRPGPKDEARSATPPDADGEPLREADVLACIRAHPDLLLRNPDAVRALELRHDCGDAVSLIERQVRILRDDNSELHARLGELLAVARQNDATAERLHELTLELLATHDFDGAVSTLRAALRDGFRADAVGLVLVASDTDSGEPDTATEFLAPDDPALAPFQPVLSGGVPVCGVHPAGPQQTLFGASASDIESAAWIPLIDEAPWGVLGIGSRDAERFHAGQGTVFLRRMGAVVGRILATRLGRRTGD